MGFTIPALLIIFVEVYPTLAFHSLGDMLGLAILCAADLVLVMLCFTGSLKQKLKIGLTIPLFLIASSLLTLPLFSFAAATYAPGSAPEVMHTNLHYLAVQLITFFVYTMMNAIFFIIYKIKQNVINIQGAFLFALLLITQVIILASLMGRTIKSPDAPMLCFCLSAGVLSILSDLGVYKAFKEINQKARIRQQAFFYQKQLEIQLSHYEQLSQYDKSLGYLRHDLKNQISTIHYLLQNHQVKDAATLTAQIRANISTLEMIACCENKIISALIFVYYQRMEKQNIGFSCNLIIPEQISDDIQSLCTLFSSALEQAMNAAPKSIILTGDYEKSSITLQCISKDGDSSVTPILLPNNG